MDVSLSVKKAFRKYIEEKSFEIIKLRNTELVGFATCQSCGYDTANIVYDTVEGSFECSRCGDDPFVEIYKRWKAEQDAENLKGCLTCPECGCVEFYLVDVHHTEVMMINRKDGSYTRGKWIGDCDEERFNLCIKCKNLFRYEESIVAKLVTLSKEKNA